MLPCMMRPGAITSAPTLTNDGDDPVAADGLDQASAVSPFCTVST